VRGRILIVDDDTALGEMLGIVLRGEGFETSAVTRGDEVMPEFEQFQPDLVLLDVMLPGMDGIEVCRAIRVQSGVPIVMLTAKSDTVDVVLGLESGADDYVVKPFDLKELEARLRAVLRRRAGGASSVIEHGRLSLDLASHELRRDGDLVPVSPREFALLHALLERPGRILSSAQLEERLYGWGEEVGSNVVEVHIHSLRRKLGADVIRNVRGVGYRVPEDPA
jgi:two-component system response regulator MtrA